MHILLGAIVFFLGAEPPEARAEVMEGAAMKVFIEDSFDSAHWLPNVPPGHKCGSMHGHTYRIRIEVRGEIGNESGWVIDYADVKYAWSIVKADLDHRSLNEIDGLENSTCELIAAWIANRLIPGLPGLSRIELRETERCGVTLEVG